MRERADRASEWWVKNGTGLQALLSASTRYQKKIRHRSPRPKSAGSVRIHKTTMTQLSWVWIEILLHLRTTCELCQKTNFSTRARCTTQGYKMKTSDASVATKSAKSQHRYLSSNFNNFHTGKKQRNCLWERLDVAPSAFYSIPRPSSHVNCAHFERRRHHLKTERRLHCRRVLWVRRLEAEVLHQTCGCSEQHGSTKLLTNAGSFPWNKSKCKMFLVRWHWVGKCDWSSYIAVVILDLLFDRTTMFCCIYEWSPSSDVVV